jgi:hypothetical protein
LAHQEKHQKAPPTDKTARQTTNYILKNGFLIAGKRLFGIIRGLGYITKEDWVGRFFLQELLTVKALFSARSPSRIKFFHKSASSSAAPTRLRCLQLAKAPRRVALHFGSGRANHYKLFGQAESSIFEAFFGDPCEALFFTRPTVAEI